MKVAELVQLGIAELNAAGIPDCTSDVFLLLGHVLGRSRTQLLVASRDDVASEQLDQFLELLNRRKRREPAAYILGEQEFWSLPFAVSPSVLIPRPETEYLLESVFTELQNVPIPPGSNIVDLCCGSGVIAIILALELNRNVVGIDLSAAALAITRGNCLRHGVENQVSLMRSDLLAAVAPARKTALVVSNPPYVSRWAMQNELEPEVKAYEPEMALDGGEQGLELIRRIRMQLPRVLMPGGRVFMEIGYDQGAAVQELFALHVEGLSDFSHVEIRKDYAGHDRVLFAVCS